MGLTDFVWIASYPRSGNTYLRTILRHAFGLRSTSIYLDDLGGNKELEDYVGHIEPHSNCQDLLKETNISLVKTHRHADDNTPAIYVIRDGRAACVSLWEFYHRKYPIQVFIEGRCFCGVWVDHVKSWNPWERPNTLLLRYEQLRDDLPTAIHTISDFLKIDIKTTSIPDRNALAGVDGRWVKKRTSWRAKLTGENLRRFVEINQDILEKAGYL